MFQRLAVWLGNQRCVYRGHQPQQKTAYRRLAPGGQEYLQARDCTCCGLNEWFLAWVDLDLRALAPADPTRGDSSLLASGEIIPEHGVKVYAGKGWTIIGERTEPLVSESTFVPNSLEPIRSRLG
jgi:hypothetical protein